jgi:hypothetical protein
MPETHVGKYLKTGLLIAINYLGAYRDVNTTIEAISLEARVNVVKAIRTP